MTIEDRLNAPAPDAGGDEGPAPSVQETETPVQSENDAGEPAPQQAPRISYETESEARSMGWVPETEWRGSKEAWRPAEEFVKRGKEVLPIVRSQLERERRRVADLETSIQSKLDAAEAAFQKRSERIERMNAIAMQKQADQLWRSFEEKKEKAVSDADVTEYQRLSKAQRDALIELQADAEPEPVAEPAPQQRQQVRVPTEVNDWIDRNATWFNKDNVLTTVASAHHAKLLKDMPALPLAENLKRVDAYLREKFPESFGIEPQPAQQRAHAPQVEAGNRQPAGSGRARGWTDLPPEAKSAGEKFVLQGLYGADQKAAREEYARDYWSQE